MKHRFEFMCPNLAEARRNRQRVWDKAGEQFYLKQARILSGWELGNPAPKGLVLGELPTITQHHNPFVLVMED